MEIKLGNVPGRLEEISDWDYVMTYGGEFLGGGLANGFYLGPTKEHQATIFSKKADLLADNTANKILKDINVVLVLNIHLSITYESIVVLCR